MGVFSVRIFRLYFALGLLVSFSSIADTKLDSLLNRLSTLKKLDSTKVSVLVDVAHAYVKKSPETGMEYAHQAIRIADSIHYKFGSAEGRVAMGMLLKNTGDNFSSEKYFLDAVTIYNSIKHPDVTGALNQLAIVYRARGEFDKALQLQFKLLRIAEERNNQQDIGGAYNNIGNLYSSFEDFEKAGYYFRLAVVQTEKSNSRKLQPIALSNYALNLLRLEKQDSVLYFMRLAYDCDFANKDDEGMASSLSNIAAAHKKLGDIDSAFWYYKASKEKYKSIGNLAAAAKQHMRIAQTYRELEQWETAIKYFEECYAAIEKTANANNMMVLEERLSECYEKTGDYKKALLHHKKFLDWRLKIFSEDNTRQAAQAELRYSFEKKEQEEKLEQAKKDELAAEKAARQTYIVIFSLCGLLVVAVFSFYLFTRLRIIRSQKKLIESQKAEVDIAYDKLHIKNKEVMDSIKYAQRIQQGLMPSEKAIESLFRRFKKQS